MISFLLVSAATAQESPTYGFDAHGFRFVTADPDPRAPLRFWRPGDDPDLGWSVGGVAEYASRPLLFEAEDGTRFVASSNLAVLNLAAGFSPVSALRIDVSAPVVLTNQYGGAPDPFGAAYATTGGGPTLDDLRVSTLFAPLRPVAGRTFGAGLVAALDLPTGSPERWLGTRGPAALLAVVGTAEADRLTASAQLGARLAPNTDPAARPAPTVGGDTVELQGGVSYLVDPAIGVGLELSAAVPFDAQVRAALSVPAEATLTGRWQGATGAHLAAGLGVGLGAGAGASPVRLVVGGGFGSAVDTTPKDTDGDGFADRDEACPLEAETPNRYLDDDGCPDTLPSVVIQPKLALETLADAAVEVTDPAGAVATSKGPTTVEGLPGERRHVEARSGACQVGRTDVTVPATGQVVVDLPLARTEGSVLLSVSDATGRPLDGAQVRYLIDEEACRATDTSLKMGRGTHVMGTGPVKLFVTAMGYDVHQSSFTLAEGEQKLVEVRLKPTSVSLKDGRVKTASALQFGASDAVLDAKSGATLQQVAALLLSLDAVPKLEIAAWASGKDAKKLSQQRADVVKEALVAFGVPVEQLTAVGRSALPRDQKEWVILSVLPTP